MPVRYQSNTWTRDPFQLGSDDYNTRAVSLRQVLAWYDGERAEYPNRNTPDLWEIVSKEENNGEGRILLHQVITDEAIEVTYTVFQGVEMNYRVRPLPPEEAYQLALDLDDRAIARGENRINERHPLPEKP